MLKGYHVTVICPSISQTFYYHEDYDLAVKAYELHLGLALRGEVITDSIFLGHKATASSPSVITKRWSIYTGLAAKGVGPQS